MIKATITKFNGSEYKVPKEVFIWVAFGHGDIETIGVECYFHKSKEEALKGMHLNEDKPSRVECLLKGSYQIKTIDLGKFTDFETMKEAIQKEVIKQLQVEAKIIGNVSKIELV